MRSEHPSAALPAIQRRRALRRALATGLLLGLLGQAAPAAAQSSQLQALREQLRQLEQLDQPELAPMADSVRELIATMEAEERAEANSESVDTADDTSTIGREYGGGYESARQPYEEASPVAPPPRPPVQIRKSHFTEIGKAAYERCPKTGQPAIDNLCPIAMIRYQNYLAEAGGSGPRTDEYWTLHEQTAIVYLAALEDFAVEPRTPVLVGGEPARREKSRNPGTFAEGGAVKTGREPTRPVLSDRPKPPPCVKSNPNASCVSPQ